MNIGIGDAVNLAWKLATVLAGRADASLLDSYEVERVPSPGPWSRPPTGSSRPSSGGTCWRGWVRALFFPYLLLFGLRFAAVRRAQFRPLSQTRIAYRQSPLSDGAAGAAHAGDRLPWVEGTDNYAPLRSLGWQVHVYGTATVGLRAFAARANFPLSEWTWARATRRAGLARDALSLVRPDGHIGFARGAQDVERLRAYLARFGIAGP